MNRILVLLLFYTLSSSLMHSQNTTGALNTTFGGDGKFTSIINGPQFPFFSQNLNRSEDIAIDNNQIYVFGTVEYASGSFNFAVIKLDLDGNLDTSFGDGGITDIDIGINSDDEGCVIQVQSDGKLILVGHSEDDLAVVRLNTNGSLDNSFGNGGIFRQNVSGSKELPREATIRSNGKIIITGWNIGSSQNDIWVAQLNANGTLDSSFGNGGVFEDSSLSDSARPTGLTLLSDGSVVISGFISFPVPPFVERDGILMKVDNTGNLVSSFGVNGTVTHPFFTYFNDIKQTSNGRFIITGTTTGSSSLIARILSNGNLDLSFGQNGIAYSPKDGFPTGLLIYPNGSIKSTGYLYSSSSNSGTRDFVVTSFDSTGVVQSCYADGGVASSDLLGSSDYGNESARDNSGNIYITGQVSDTNFDSYFGVLSIYDSIDDNDLDCYATPIDCNDSDANINPTAIDIPNNGIDENCDGLDDPCPNFYASSDSILKDTSIYTGVEIVLDGTIISPTDVLIESDTIRLLSGFKAQQGVSLRIVADGCAQ